MYITFSLLGFSYCFTLFIRKYVPSEFLKILMDSDNKLFVTNGDDVHTMFYTALAKFVQIIDI